MKYLFLALGLVAILLVGWLLMRPVAAPEVPAVAQVPAQELPPLQPVHRAQPGAPDGDPDMPPELAGIPLHDDAISSLRGAREFGDPRTPPIGRSAPREEPTPEELADPEKYAEYEARQERKVKRAYVIAAETYTKQLRDDIEKGKAMGIPPDEIAKVQEKVRLIEQMRAKLLAADPGLLDASSPVPRRTETPPAPGTDKAVPSH